MEEMDQWHTDKIEKYTNHHVENARSNARGVLLVVVYTEAQLAKQTAHLLLSWEAIGLQSAGTLISPRLCRSVLLFPIF
jgi:hypothetical protein